MLSFIYQKFWKVFQARYELSSILVFKKYEQTRVYLQLLPQSTNTIHNFKPKVCDRLSVLEK